MSCLFLLKTVLGIQNLGISIFKLSLTILHCLFMSIYYFGLTFSKIFELSLQPNYKPFLIFSLTAQLTYFAIFLAKQAIVLAYDKTNLLSVCFFGNLNLVFQFLKVFIQSIVLAEQLILTSFGSL